jgi:hypothetical protein
VFEREIASEHIAVIAADRVPQDPGEGVVDVILVTKKLSQHHKAFSLDHDGLIQVDLSGSHLLAVGQDRTEGVEHRAMTIFGESFGHVPLGVADLL